MGEPHRLVAIAYPIYMMRRPRASRDCGQLGKQANCQVAVTLSLANRHASLPVAYRGALLSSKGPSTVNVVLELFASRQNLPSLRRHICP
jgi:hypothetical protein